MRQLHASSQGVRNAETLNCRADAASVVGFERIDLFNARPVVPVEHRETRKHPLSVRDSERVMGVASASWP